MADLWELVRTSLILVTLLVVGTASTIILIGLIHLYIKEALAVIRKL